MVALKKFARYKNSLKCFQLSAHYGFSLSYEMFMKTDMAFSLILISGIGTQLNCPWGKFKKTHEQNFRFQILHVESF